MSSLKNFFYKINDNFQGIRHIIDNQIELFHPAIPCELLNNFGIFIQGILAIASFSVLIVKRILESPQRPWKIWFMDVSKQGITALNGHLMNIYLSEKLGDSNLNQCNWYFINLIVDIFIGTYLNIIIFKEIEIMLANSEKYYFKSGEYGENGCFKKWAYQTFIWFCGTILIKIFIFLLLCLNTEFFGFFAEFLLIPFENYPKLELIFVMVFLPFILNSFAFWISDLYLKKEKNNNIENEVKEKSIENLN